MHQAAAGGRRAGRRPRLALRATRACPRAALLAGAACLRPPVRALASRPPGRVETPSTAAPAWLAAARPSSRPPACPGRATGRESSARTAWRPKKAALHGGHSGAGPMLVHSCQRQHSFGLLGPLLVGAHRLLLRLLQAAHHPATKATLQPHVSDAATLVIQAAPLRLQVVKGEETFPMLCPALPP